MIKLDYVPRYSERFEYYGHPDVDGDYQWDPGWWNENMVKYKLPFPQLTTWEPRQAINYLWFHKLVGPSIVDALDEIQLRFKDKPYNGVWNILGDAASIRPMKGQKILSNHALGVCIDENPDVACWQCEPDSQHPWIDEAFRKRGFVCGADFPPPRVDPMHYQAVGM